MALKKVLFFTAGSKATAGEIADIAKLNAAAVPQYEVLVLNGSANAEYGETDRIVESDYVAGTVPTEYNAVDVMDPDDIPNQALSETQAIVNDAEALVVSVTGTYTDTVTFTVEAGAITAIVLS